MTRAERGEQNVRFGIFEADLHARELRRKGLTVVLQDLPFRFLALLLERPGEVVTREELSQRLWPGGTFVDYDHGINTAANKLREALGDTADNPLFIQTVPRRGYRFIAPVEPIGDPGPPPSAVPTRWARSALFAAAGAMAFVAASVSYSWLVGGRTDPQPEPDRYKLVVLPMADFSRQPQDFLADGLTEEVTAQLGRLSPERLGVIGRTSAMTYKGSTKTVEEIGRELDVEYVIEGSIRSEDGRRHVTIQLVEVDDQTHVWARTYEYEGADVLALQRDVAEQVTAALTLEVLEPQNLIASDPRGVDAETYEAYLRGRFFRLQLTEPGFRRGIESFETAIRRSPEFAPAYAGLAGCFCLLAGHGLEVVPVPEAMSQARDAAQKALALDPASAEAHAVMGMVKLKYEWDGAEAERRFRRAIAINPSYEQAYVWYSMYLTATERHDEAVAAALRARELDPLSMPVNINLVQQLYEAQRYDEAVEAAERALELAPLSWGLSWGLGMAYRELGLEAAAIEALERATMLDGGDNTLAIATLGYTYGLAQREADARLQLERLIALEEERHVSPAHIAVVYAGLGQNEEVLHWLERAYDVRSRSLIWLRVAHEFTGIREDPRFQALVQRVGL